MLTDNRWSPGASGATVPSDTTAAYAARWIDQGDTIPADVVPDRQGFAYDDPADRDKLIALMSQGEGTAIRTPYKANFLDRDVTTVVMNHPEWKCYVRRAGGYVYVDAWLVTA